MSIPIHEGNRKKRPRLRRKQEPTTQAEVYVRTAEEIHADKVFIAKRLIESVANKEILIELNKQRPYELSYETLRKIVYKIQNEWLLEIATTAHKARVEEIARIDAMEQQAWDSWYKSKGKVVNRAFSAMESAINQDGKASPLKSKTLSRSEHESPGDVKYMNIIQWCVETRCELLGLVRKGAQVLVEDAPAGLDEKEVFTTAVIIESDMGAEELTNFPFVNENDNPPVIDDPEMT